jgi:hypothetical protein
MIALRAFMFQCFGSDTQILVHLHSVQKLCASSRSHCVSLLSRVFSVRRTSV